MMNVAIWSVMSMLPMVLVYLAALIMAIAFWGDYPQTCAKVLAGALIMLLTTILQPVMQAQVVRTGVAMGTVGQSIMMISMVANVVRAVGFGLIVWAAFAGRISVSDASGFPVLPRAEE